MRIGRRKSVRTDDVKAASGNEYTRFDVQGVTAKKVYSFLDVLLLKDGVE